MRKKKILLFLISGISGLSTVCESSLEVAEDLAANSDFHVTALIWNSNPLQKLEVNLKHPIQTKLISKGEDAYKTYASLVTETKPDLIVGMEYWMMEVAKENQCAFIFDAHFLIKDWIKYNVTTELMSPDVTNNFRKFNSEDLFKNNLQLKKDLRAEEETLKYSSLIIANSEAMAKSLYEDLPPSRCLQANLISKKFNPSATSNAHFKKSAACFDAVFLERKGLHRLLKQASFPFELQFFGLMEGEAAYLSETHRHRIHPWIPDKESLEQEILKFPFILFPSAYESFGLLLSECLALGRVCLVQANNPGLKDQIIDGKTGFLIDFKSDDWPHQIEAIMEKPSKTLQQISQEAIRSYLDDREKNNRAQIISEAITKFLA